MNDIPDATLWVIMMGLCAIMLVTPVVILGVAALVEYREARARARWLAEVAQGQRQAAE